MQIFFAVGNLALNPDIEKNKNKNKNKNRNKINKEKIILVYFRVRIIYPCPEIHVLEKVYWEQITRNK